MHLFNVFLHHASSSGAYWGIDTKCLLYSEVFDAWLYVAMMINPHVALELILGFDILCSPYYGSFDLRVPACQIALGCELHW